MGGIYYNPVITKSRIYDMRLLEDRKALFEYLLPIVIETNKEVYTPLENIQCLDNIGLTDEERITTITSARKYYYTSRNYYEIVLQYEDSSLGTAYYNTLSGDDNYTLYYDS